MFLTDSHAKSNVGGGYVGTKYRPANGTEGDIFYQCYCSRCTGDVYEDCDVLAKTYTFDEESKEYPIEWQYDDKGQPTCTAFTVRNEK